MNPDIPETGRELRSLVTPDGQLEISIVRAPIPRPTKNQVLVRVEAAPINPSDLGSLFVGANPESAELTGLPDQPVLRLGLSPALARSLAGRTGVSLPVGLEGAGTVVATGEADSAKVLLGHTVSLAPGGMYTEYRLVDAAACLELPDGISADAGASSFVNPLTALGMTETMRMEGHTALVHTAAASNLGQMLNRLCQANEIPLVNIVRKKEQEALLSSAGAEHICNSSSESFKSDLTGAIRETSATLGFDAVGGGDLAGTILDCMERATAVQPKDQGMYGSARHKQVYIYGRLDGGPTTLSGRAGFAWGLGGWLLFHFLRRIGPERVAALQQEVRDGLQTTFASNYTREISLDEALEPEVVMAYTRIATGEKFLITPDR